MSSADTNPSISKTAFACPHCRAYASQSWHQVYSRRISGETPIPTRPTARDLNEYSTARDLQEEVRKSLTTWARKMLTEAPFFEGIEVTTHAAIHNCNASVCFNCGKPTIWVGNSIAYPNTKIEIDPNPDLPEEVLSLFEEAREIVGVSPKGAAALLRLSVQHLCKSLGESGKHIESDIASLVSKGLSPIVQQALDVVRVIGNEAVHPGEINFDDNRDIALQLFGLINLICEQMITIPRKVNGLYESLPQSKREAIEKRNNKAKQKAANEQTSDKN